MVKMSPYYISICLHTIVILLMLYWQLSFVYITYIINRYVIRADNIKYRKWYIINVHYSKYSRRLICNVSKQTIMTTEILLSVGLYVSMQFVFKTKMCSKTVLVVPFYIQTSLIKYTSWKFFHIFQNVSQNRNN